MKRGVSVLVCCVVAAGCAGIAIETTYIPAPTSGWKVGHARDEGWFGKGNIVELVPENESINSWTKLITIQFFERSKVLPRAAMEGVHQHILQACHGNVGWEVIKEDETSILYEWRGQDCTTGGTQHEISKYLKGNAGLHRAAYTEKVSQMDKETHDRWVGYLSNAYVEKGGKRVVIK
jgi:hypothetical protein